MPLHYICALHGFWGHVRVCATDFRTVMSCQDFRTWLFRVEVFWVSVAPARGSFGYNVTYISFQRSDRFMIGTWVLCVLCEPQGQVCVYFIMMCFYISDM